ncbi:MAG: transporter [Acidobacteria bacterium]|nr:MAG: transporter [Acidobacteriota bacterium]
MGVNQANSSARAANEETPAVISTPDEEKRVEERVAINAHVVYEAIRREGEEELSRSNSALAWSALAAGLSMGISFLAEALLRAHLPDLPWSPLVSRTGYAVGFLVVVLGRQQLFTENTLTVILPLMQRANVTTFLNVLRLWAVVLFANLLGTYLFAACVAKVALFDPKVVRAFTDIGVAHTGMSFSVAFVRAIFAGWLIALMVWLLPGADSSRVSIIIILTYLIGLGGFNHIVAGSTTVFFLLVNHALSWTQYLSGFFLPTLLGNIIGGLMLVSALAHAQVVGGRQVPGVPNSTSKETGRKKRKFLLTKR